MRRRKTTNVSKQLGWRVDEFSDIVGIGRAFCYSLMNEGMIESVKIGGARIIITPPEKFLQSAKDDI